MEDNSRDGFSNAGTSNSADDGFFTDDVVAEPVAVRKSVIRQHFMSIDTKSAKCNDCGKILKCTPSSATSLLHHIRTPTTSMIDGTYLQVKQRESILISTS